MEILFDNTPYLEYIKISRIDQNGNDNTISLQSLTQITLPFTDGTSTTYLIDNITRYNTYFLFGIKKTGANAPLSADSSSLNYSFTGSIDGGVIDMRAVGGIAAPFPTINGTGSSVSFLYNSSANRIELGTYPEIPIHVKATGFYVTSSAEVFVDLYKADSFYTPSSIVKLTTSTAIQGGALKGPFTREVSISGSAHGGDTLFLGASTNVFPVAGGPFVKVEGGDGRGSIASIFITSSTELVGPTISSVLEPYLTSQFEGTDCDVLLNNESLYRENPFLQDIDYSGNPFVPINFNQLLSGSAAKGTVPESYYTALSQTNIRYNGSKAQSSGVNIYDPNAGNSDFGKPINIGTYGQTPPVNSLSVNIYEFEWGGGTTPEIVGYGAVKIGRIMGANSAEDVKIIQAGEDANKQLQKIILPISVSPSLWGRNSFVTQSVSSYYYALNSLQPNDPINMFGYATNGNSTPILPPTTKVLTSDYGVPSNSSYGILSDSFLSSSTYLNPGNGFLTTQTLNPSSPSSLPFLDSSTPTTSSYIQLFNNRGLNIMGSDYAFDDGVVQPSYLITGSGVVEYSESISKNYTGSIVPIAEELNRGERWFVTFYDQLSVDFNGDELVPFQVNQSPLGEKGVKEIIGLAQDATTGVYMLLDSPLNPDLFENSTTGSESLVVGRKIIENGNYVNGCTGTGGDGAAVGSYINVGTNSGAGSSASGMLVDVTVGTLAGGSGLLTGQGTFINTGTTPPQDGRVSTLMSASATTGNLQTFLLSDYMTVNSSNGTGATGNFLCTNPTGFPSFGDGAIDVLVINNTGSGYELGDSFSITGAQINAAGSNINFGGTVEGSATFTVVRLDNTTITAINLKNVGSGYVKGQNIYVNANEMGVPANILELTLGDGLFSPDGKIFSYRIGGGGLGMFMWKARSAGKNEFVMVQDLVTGGVGAGAFTSKFTPKYISDNFNNITKEYGNNI
tara:strand:+ start:1330 stop:4215 length:2886 start_codon:yes stop_codon:yes gene_type:complete